MTPDTASTGTYIVPGAAALRCCIYGAGVVLFLLIQGLFQERIMTVPYDKDLWSDSFFLVFCNRIAVLIFALCMMLRHGEAMRPSASWWKYFIISCANVLSSFSQYEALKHVSYPVAMLGKSFKMMPVMAWGLLISRKRYGCFDWLVALAVTGGVTEFVLTGSIDSPANGNSWQGLLWLMVYLVADSLTSTMQEKLFREDKTSTYNQMLYVTVGSSVISFAGMLPRGNLQHGLAFCRSHPEVLLDISSLSASAVASQWFIYSQVKEFGALVLAATMNLRQVVSVLASYFTYGHVVTWLQILGLAIVFTSLFTKSYVALFDETKSNVLKAHEDAEAQPLMPKTRERAGSRA